MLKSFKTEIRPTEEQIVKINKTIGTCRFIYNFYIAHNKELYENGEKFMSGRRFSVWLNNEYIPNNHDKMWIKEVSAHSVKKSMEDAYVAFNRFFKHKSRFPRFKKKNKSDVKMYFVKNNKTDCLSERHRIKVPTLGWVRLKEKGYIPTSKDGFIVRSGTISHKAGRYYISVLVDIQKQDTVVEVNNGFGIGIDLGLKEFAVCSNGSTYQNINKMNNVKKIEKRLKREQRKLSRKVISINKGESTQKNFVKQKLKVQRLYQRLTNVRTDYLNKTIHSIVKTKPSFIVIEDLNVHGMMKNRYLSKAVAQQKFFEFKTKLISKCKENNIELRVVDRWYPSSKLCHNCGHVKKDLKLSDRTYRCDICGYVEDRDINASLNLRDANTYTIIQ
uniref:Endonuclease n=1 Tax=Myoviridae sp. ctdNl2 TaxID=2825140 RepID=A0A8S5QGQ4_9CAUD|nr:MAG TPA: endonuclease [Myoviridae sp. ctdNl2]